MEWKKIYEVKRRTPEEAVKLVRSGDRVFIGSASSIAWKLAEALYARRDELENVVILHGLTPRVLPFFLPEAKGHFSTISYFAGFGGRAGIQNGQTQFTSIHLSEIRTWCHEVARPNVAFFEVSPPDENGYMSYGAFGTSFHDYVKEQAGTVLLQVNRNAPRVFGENNRIHITEADYVTEADDELWEIPDLPVDDTIRTLSGHIVELIPDGATLQLGLGGIANAVGYGLKDHNDLGIHTEMLSDSMMELMKSGVVTNQRKTYMKGRTVTAFAVGSRKLYDFIDHNEDIYFAPYYRVNDPAVIAKNDNMMSINTAMAVDLYGQVAADCLAGHQQSATGGQVDFVRGAQMAKGGKSFIALTSTLTRKDGRRMSRIMPYFPPGTAVTTARSDVQYVATEHGCVNLKALPMYERVKAIIGLAHPDYRDELTDKAKELHIL